MSLQRQVPSEHFDNSATPEVIAQEIVDDLEAALEQFRLIANDLRHDVKGDVLY